MIESDDKLQQVRSEESIDEVIGQIVSDGSSQGDDVDNDIKCEQCGLGDNESKLVLCDTCPRGWHTYCQQPKLEGVPEGDWSCPHCPKPKRRSRFLWTTQLQQMIASAVDHLGGTNSCKPKRILEMMQERTPNDISLPDLNQIANRLRFLRKQARQQQNLGTSPSDAADRRVASAHTATRPIASAPTQGPTTSLLAADLPGNQPDNAVAEGIIATDDGNGTGLVAADNALTHPSAPARLPASRSRGTKRKGAHTATRPIADFGCYLATLFLAAMLVYSDKCVPDFTKLLSEPRIKMVLQELANKSHDCFDSLWHSLQEKSLRYTQQSLPIVARRLGHMLPKSWHPYKLANLIQCYEVHCQVTTCLGPKLPGPNMTQTATCPASAPLFELS